MVYMYRIGHESYAIINFMRICKFSSKGIIKNAHAQFMFTVQNECSHAMSRSNKKEGISALNIYLVHWILAIVYDR